ncbi:Unknown protein sequence [Pseudomonas syringae pv. aceris]|nr:Unknown protein sequence [Pseudomonas syringae pv. aceris]
MYRLQLEHDLLRKANELIKKTWHWPAGSDQLGENDAG